MPSLDAPVPISALDLIFALNVDFNHPLVVALLDPTSWSVREGNERFTIGSATAGPFPANRVVLGYNFPPVPDIGPNTVSYSPPPFDLISDTTKQIAAPAFTFNF